MQKSESDYNLIDWWKKVFLRNYATFTGRARRSELWYYTLANMILVIPFYIIAMIGMAGEQGMLSTVGLLVYIVVILATFVPSLAVAVRRLHDVNRSGWFYFIAMIPLIGGIILLVWFCTEGDRYTNNYGPDPKDPNEVVFDFEQATN